MHSAVYTQPFVARRRGRLYLGQPVLPISPSVVTMVLRLHVWGPAFGLASIDAECLATIAYLAYALPATAEWELVATSPSGVPTRK